MKLKLIKLKNFRQFRGEQELAILNHTVLHRGVATPPPEIAGLLPCWPVKLNVSPGEESPPVVTMIGWRNVGDRLPGGSCQRVETADAVAGQRNTFRF